MFIRRFLALGCLFALAIAKDISAQEREDDELKSPDQGHSIRILRSAGAKSDILDASVISVWKGRQCLSSFPTFGWLIEAHWSPNGRHVAVNNRRANSGDYLWVFRLSDGHAIRKPVDAETAAPEDAYDKYVRQVQKRAAGRYPAIESLKVRRLFHAAQGWTGPGILRVETTITFLAEAEVIEITERHAVKADRLVLLDRKTKLTP